ncbi:MAG TPA: ribonuclease domain-containing protein [Acidimicrobiales bacterium]
MNRRTRSRVVAVLLAGTLVLTLVGGLLSATGNQTGPGDDSSTQTTVSAPPVTQASDLPPIGLEELPVEAVETLQLVAQGGPFPYERDGATFQNREGLLPEQPEGYYKEYTVPTPGESDRGARRLIVGEGNEVYYTADHYESFQELVLG